MRAQTLATILAGRVGKRLIGAVTVFFVAPWFDHTAADAASLSGAEVPVPKRRFGWAWSTVERTISGNCP